MSLFGLFERRSPENPAVPLTSATLLEWMGGPRTSSGVRVSEKGALAFSAVWRCTSLISGVSSALPLHVYRDGTHDRQPSQLLKNPHPELTALEVWRLTYAHRCLWGNAYVQKVRDNGGRVRELWPVTPDRVQVDREKPTVGNPSGKTFWVTDDWGGVHRLTPREILHMPGMGYDGVCGVSPVRAASAAIGLALAAEEYGARLFGSGNLMSGILQTEQRLENDDADRLKARWKAKMSGLDKAHDIAVLDSGASFQPVSLPAKDSQFLESRSFEVEEIGRWFGVPHFLLGLTAKSTSWGTGLEQQAIGWVKFDLHPTWLAPTEQRLTKELLGASVTAGYKIEGLLRGDSRARAEFYRVMREVGAFSANDIRDLEDLPPVDGGDLYLQPMNMAPLGSDPTEPDEPSDDLDDDEGGE
ncbi:phage portal protein [Nonomuraea gerenzanensis]|uniref:Phage portal protein n=1 Tax=Nonomuraea gerenzanensis TaxID=93944 RepID=A0A1M4BKU9_9ACTN|nr:phage portal protein [Nonomuraea gerenzanensis]UBU10023.1 phage portal protein [Nonomuraea gerenzanensis]SAP16268.1 Phage portal protein [Nonomuraea gerenzanensis]